MPQIGPLEVLLVGVIALIVFGPQRLPEIARSVGKAVAEFRRQASDLREEFSAGLDADDVEDEQGAPPEEPPSDDPPEEPPSDDPPEEPPSDGSGA